MKKLTIKEQKFAELCVTLGNQTEAYRQAYNPSNKDAEWVKVRASETANKSNVKVTIGILKEEAKKEHGIDRAFIINGLQEIINDADYTFNLGRKEGISKEDKQAFFRIMQQTKNTDKLRALESLAKMLGLNEPDKIEHKHTITKHDTKWG